MKINQLKAGVILSYVSIGISSVTQLAYTPIMLRLLGKSEYGLYSLVSSVVSYLGLLTFGIGGAYLRFYTKMREEDQENGVARLNGMFLLVFVLIGAIALLAGLLLAGNVTLVFGDKLTESEHSKASLLLVLLAINLAISIPASIFNSYITAHEQYFFQRVLSITTAILNPFLTLPLLLMGMGSLSLVSISLFMTIVSAAFNIWFCTHRLHIHFLFGQLQWGLLKEIYVFSFFIFLNQIIDQVNWSVDSFLLGRFWGTTEVAIYGLASRINSLYLSFSTAISSVFAPRINRIAAAGGDRDRQLLNLMIRVGRIQSLILCLVLMGLVLLGKPFLLWMGGDVSYLRSYSVLLMLIVPVTIPLVQNLGLEIQRAENKHQFRSLIYAGMAAANVCLSIPLNAKYGAPGAAIGTALSLLLGNGIVMNWYYHSHLGLNMVEFWRAMRSLGLGAMLPIVYCLVCGATLNLFHPAVFFLAGTGLVVVYAASMWRWGMNGSEKDLIRRPLSKLCKIRVKSNGSSGG